MANLITLPALGAALFVAAGTGVYLGESSVGLIKPIYFQGPAIHPRDRGAAVDPNRIRPSTPAFADLYGWDQGNAALARDCVNCDALRARDAYAYSAAVPYFGSGETVRPAVYEPQEEPEPEYRRPPVPASEVGPRIARYANVAPPAEEAAADADYKARDVYLADGAAEDVDADYDE